MIASRNRSLCPAVPASPLLAALLAVGLNAKAQDDLVIDSFESGGTITFNKVTNATGYGVEWAPEPGGPGTNTWELVDAIPAAGSGIVTASVPITGSSSVYRVVATVTNPPAGGPVTFEWVTVGNPGNAADQDFFWGHFGSVANTYRISAYEVTNDQYAEFLNAVADADPNGLFKSGMHITQSGASPNFTYAANATFGRKALHRVTFFDAMRFVNWLENGQPTGAQGAGTTEAGVYTIGTGLSETRAAGASFFIPSEDEWYKAAYHDPRLAGGGGPPGDDNYWLYPTQSDGGPTAEAPPGGANSANFDSVVGDTTDVGAYTSTTSFYGAFDLGGNLTEWNEAVVSHLGAGAPTSRALRGGSWFHPEHVLQSSGRSFADPTLGSTLIGFRVASPP